MSVHRINEGINSDPAYNLDNDEFASLSNFTQQTEVRVTREPTINDLKRYMQNPYAHLDKIREISVFLTNKHGILKDVLRMFKSMPTLKYRIGSGNNIVQEQNEKNSRIIQQFLKDIDVVEFVRDGMWEVAEQGTVVTCLRSGRYIQFLNIDDLRINRQKDGRWVVEYDLSKLNSLGSIDIKKRIESLPDEVTLKSYNTFRKHNHDSNRFIELNNCHVVKMDGKRNMPYGLPLTMGAWTAILQKEIISNTERSVADRIIKQILVLEGGYYDDDKKSPIKIGTLKRYFDEISKVMQSQEESGSKGSTSGGVATLAIPHYISLDTLKIDTKLFEKELYDKVSNDIYENLGVSPALIAGLEGNYASANANNEKFFSFIASTIEKFEKIINLYIEDLIGEHSGHEISFERATVLDKKEEVNRNKEFYLQTGNPQPWIESLYGSGSFMPILEQTKYMKEKLDISNVFFPPQNAYTSSGKDNEKDNSGNDNTIKSKTNDGNSTPSPSDK